MSSRTSTFRGVKLGLIGALDALLERVMGGAAKDLDGIRLGSGRADCGAASFTFGGEADRPVSFLMKAENPPPFDLDPSTLLGLVAGMGRDGRDLGAAGRGMTTGLRYQSL